MLKIKLLQTAWSCPFLRNVARSMWKSVRRAWNYSEVFLLASFMFRVIILSSSNVRSSPLEVLLQKGVLKICSKFTGEHLFPRPPLERCFCNVFTKERMPIYQVNAILKKYDSAYEYKKHCVKIIRIRSYCGPYFPAFGANTERY